MENNTPEISMLKNRLKHYSALAASLVALDAAGQVVYTDIKDTTLVNNGDYFDIDLNNDGIFEGRIEMIDVSSSFYSIQLKVKGAVVNSFNNASVNAISSVTSSSSTTSTVYLAAALNRNVNINNSLNIWSNGSGNATSSGSSSSVLLGADFSLVSPSSTSSNSVGQFPGAGDKFLGVKFTIGTNTHYGWMRLDMSADSDSLTIKDFAYDSTANAAILAGDTGTTVGLSVIEQDKKIEYYSSNGKIIFKTKPSANSTLSIFDLSGRLIQTEAIGIQNEFSFQGSLEGIYIVEIRDSKGVTRKKLWLESN